MDRAGKGRILLNILRNCPNFVRAKSVEENLLPGCTHEADDLL